MEGHSIEVVNISVFPIAVVKVVFWHGGFRTVEDRRLVHVVPDKEILSRPLES